MLDQMTLFFTKCETGQYKKVVPYAYQILSQISCAYLSLLFKILTKVSAARILYYRSFLTLLYLIPIV